MSYFRNVFSRYILLIALYIPLVIFSVTLILEKSSSGIPLSIFSGTRGKIENMSGFTITAYCPGPCCNGQWPGLTSSGKLMDDYKKSGILIAAVDPSVIPLGSIILYSNKEFLAADVGKLIQGKKIDILVNDHKSTFIFGKHDGQNIHVIKSSK